MENYSWDFFGNFWTFKTQDTENNYIYVENNIYKKLKEAVEIYKNQTKSFFKQTAVFKQKYMKYILYVLLNVMLLETVSFLYYT